MGERRKVEIDARGRLISNDRDRRALQREARVLDWIGAGDVIEDLTAVSIGERDREDRSRHETFDQVATRGVGRVP